MREMFNDRKQVYWTMEEKEIDMELMENEMNVRNTLGLLIVVVVVLLSLA